MMLRRGWTTTFLWALVIFFCGAATSSAYVLVADRKQNRILKYSDGGAFLNVVVKDDVNLAGPTPTFSGPSAFTLSPDRTQLWVASLNSSVVRYDFNGTVATNPLKITSTASTVIADPGGVLVTPDNSTVFASNRGFGGSNSIARLSPAGASLGANLAGGAPNGRTGLALDPTGQLLAGTFGSDFMGGGTGGGVVRYSGGSTSVLIADTLSLAGVATLLVNGTDLYLTASIGVDGAGRIAKFNVNTGAPDAAFGTGGLATPPIPFPAGLTRNAGGTELLVSMLGLTDGSGRIDRYSFTGVNLGVWANNSLADPSLGFVEATALLQVVPEPSTLAGAGLLAVGLAVRRRSRSRG